MGSLFLFPKITWIWIWGHLSLFHKIRMSSNGQWYTVLSAIAIMNIRGWLNKLRIVLLKMDLMIGRDLSPLRILAPIPPIVASNIIPTTLLLLTNAIFIYIN